MLKLYNTLTRQKEEFTPLDANNVRMYVCGPTVYARPHLGNARSVVVYDVLYRLLRHLYGAEHVTYVRNITDVDDKINAAAIERGISIQQLTEEVTGWFHADMDALNCLRPTHEPRATQYISQMIQMIERLIANGNAYVAQGHVLFDVTKGSGVRGQESVVGSTESRIPNPESWHYGMLSGRTTEEQQAGARVAVESYKRHPGDFVLWKPADAEDDASSKFDSPWGVGRPGWHIECSAMSTDLLGKDFDIHGGGADLKFPHHENEIAQSRCAHPDSVYARTWVHNGFLTVNGEKMSKSLGNFITVRDLLEKGVHGEVIRLALLSAKYNEPLNWTDKLVEDAKKTLDYLYRVIQLKKPNHEQLLREAGIKMPILRHDKYRRMTKDIEDDLSISDNRIDIEDDLKVSDSVAFALKLASYMKSFSGKDADQAEIIQYLLEWGHIVGLLKCDPEIWFKGTGDDSKIESHITARAEAKKAKNWAEADRIRDELKAQGIILEDRPDGTTDWRRA